VRSLKTGLVAALTGAALVVTSLPAFGVNVTTASFYSPPAGEAPSPGFTLETTLVDEKPAFSNIYKAAIDVLRAAGSSNSWDPRGGLGNNCVTAKTNPTVQDLADCGISSVEVIRFGQTAYQALALTQIRIHPTLNLYELEWSKNEVLIMAGSKLRVVFLPNAFETKLGNGYQARTQLSFWCTGTSTNPAHSCYANTSANPNNTGVGINGIWRTSSTAPFDVLPVTLPPAPLAPTVEAGDSRATVTPVPDPTSAGVTSFTVTANTGETCTVAFPDVSCEVTGLTNGTEYTFTTTATNGAGTSPSSPSSTCVVPNVAGGVTTCGSGATEGSSDGNSAGSNSGTGSGKENKRPSQAVTAPAAEPVAMAGDTLARTGVNPAHSILLATVSFALVALGGLATYARRTLK
jgi:hypothetical protein